MARIMDYFTAEGMLRDERETGCLPSTKEAYLNNLRLAWPSAVEGLGLSMATMADTAMVGSLGAEAIAAVGIPRLPIFMVTAVIRSLNIGLTATLSRKYGAGDKKGVICCFKQGFLISAVLGILMLLFVESFSRQIVVFAGAGTDIADMAEEYYKIICVGNFFNCMSLSVNAAQIGTGNTKISMITNITANAVNLIMNYFLIYGKGPFPMLGTRGAAMATALGYMTAFALSVYSVSHKEKLLYLYSYEGWKPEREVIESMGRIGIPALAENMLMQCGFFVHQKLVAGLGTAAVAAHQVGNSIYNISFYFGDGLANACASMVGRQLGAKRKDLAMLYGKVAQRTALVVSLVFCLIMCLAKNSLPALFTSDERVLALMPSIVMTIGFLTILQTSGLVYSGALRGAGDTTYVALSSLVCITIVRPLMAYLFMYVFGMGILGGWAGYLVDQGLRVVFGSVRFKRGKWRSISI